MPTTPDRQHGSREEEEIIFDDRTPDNPSIEGAVRRVNNDLVAFVGGQVKSLTAGGDAQLILNRIVFDSSGRIVFDSNGDVVIT